MAGKPHIKIRRGLDLPVEEVPRPDAVDAPPGTRVGLVGRDGPGLRRVPRVADHTQRFVATVADDTPMFDVARLFIDGHFRRYPMMRGHRLVGQASRRDVLRALSDLSQVERHEV